MAIHSEKKTIMVLAGEPSGEKHVSFVIREIKNQYPDWQFYGMGGDLMKKEGCELLFHVNQTSFMGFAEVVKHLPIILDMKKTLVGTLDSRKPDLVLLVDYPGFNLRFAEEAHKRGIPVFYFISPQIWAWGKGRLKDIQRLITRMLVILPFEKQLYDKAGVECEFVGHPLTEQISLSMSKAEFFRIHNLDDSIPLVSLLPGSRVQEIKSLLPLMIDAVEPLRRDGKIQAVIAGVKFVDNRLYDLAASAGIPVIFDETHLVMSYAQQAVVASGTATLETSLCGTPLTVVYKTSWPTYFIGRYLVNLKWISLVNIISDEEVVPELIQHDATPESVRKSILRFMDPEIRIAALQKIARLRNLLSEKSASKSAAGSVISFLMSKS
ncbi:MAG: lipid-A-disaccharide synthase [Bacteroidetes bacterium]|nr:lipid-A-disaccharide synthase [Bacteroidota bacterium]